ncbi:tRNA (adenosine(37)-N6)-dimethylallyltransferase MiaA [Herbaspirillum sp. LeCh32-8]|uniref:tRNA (adenosine(37)-N6)-dimethylallyltransferase MiaA n=1 Tax=Herbaspirillum sp. LeCh32-8 TaxID=2821356 RepID=UPI001AE65E16|nr:tRNA (adenosine(37)-N6)-dimethylallyltransferase MiaA [Herbaspirillum sp. LeCh32-8]MBP0598811.1 tRNA (adenosine(37)-N6)-dimethylallyltransferase MiaA [Herbaspirillum sp. LeCh32-8]
MTATPVRPLAVAIMGPTASGKTAAALEIARRIPSEIISVDSALVYRGMDVGTAKPSREELAEAPHHLIDIIDPADAYSAMQFRQDALRLCMEIAARGKLPLLVGGTMLYFKVLRDGLDELPQADPALRAQLDEEAARVGMPAMHAKLAGLDPVTAERLKPNDSQRIQRALEITLLTGQPMSSLLSQKQAEPLPFDLLPLALEPSDRAFLHERIALRFDLMLKGGALEQEVQTLRARGDLNLGLPSMRCVGYRQMWEYLDGDIDFAAMREKGIAATRQLAKRQLTWLRSMPDRVVIDCNLPSATEQVWTTVEQAISARAAG